ncbi:Polyketide biosynthesis malonyl CoA-acyl carrier protein transacylase PksC [bioreactor metagenome]|uniref:[acyl-carrier-protein] S-malonyltransferase n=1 Tax=bioreactor metagenome TaxID=1076179 RepID=A0A645BNK8_9ZZZZ
MKTAFLFPGQGAQAVGMGADLYESSTVYRAMFDACQAQAGLDLQSACFEGKGMDNSGVIQAAIYSHTVSLLGAVRAAGADADVFAGLSLGEYSALAAADVLDAARGAALVRQRGEIMDGAVPPGTGGMLSVVGLTLEQVETVIAPFASVFVANHLSETQLTLGGLLGELGEAKAALEAAGARMAVMLAMKGPSHCPLLNAAAEQFSVELAGETFDAPSGIVYSNVLGEPYPKNADFRRLLCTQMNTRVRWHDCIEQMLAHGVTRFIEIGPGGVLTKMLKRRASREIALYSVQDEASFEVFLRAEKEGGT